MNEPLFRAISSPLVGIISFSENSGGDKKFALGCNVGFKRLKNVLDYSQTSQDFTNVFLI